MALLPFGSPPTPDASASKKGKVQLAGDLGGTAASPTVPTKVNKSGDTMTGALAITLATGNSLVVDTETLVVDASNGRVGIGTATPLQLLHLVGGILRVDQNGSPAYMVVNRTDGKAATLTAGNTTSGLRFDDTGTFTIGSQAAANIIAGSGSGITNYVTVSTTPYMHIYNNDNAVLQTGSIFQISHTSGALQTLWRQDASTSANDRIGMFQFGSNDTQLTTQNIFANIEVQSTATVATDAAAGRMIFRTTGTAAGGSPVERMRIDELGNIGINGAANANAILDLTSTTKAFMPPRMTTTQKNNIASPTAGMVVYDTTLNKLCVYTTAWETITSA